MTTFPLAALHPLETWRLKDIKYRSWDMLVSADGVRLRIRERLCDTPQTLCQERVVCYDALQVSAEILVEQFEAAKG